VTGELHELFVAMKKYIDENNVALQAEKVRADKAEARVTELVEALEFYADRNTYFAARKALAKAKDGERNVAF